MQWVKSLAKTPLPTNTYLRGKLIASKPNRETGKCGIERLNKRAFISQVPFRWIVCIICSVNSFLPGRKTRRNVGHRPAEAFDSDFLLYKSAVTDFAFSFPRKAIIVVWNEKVVYYIMIAVFSEHSLKKKSYRIQ